MRTERGSGRRVLLAHSVNRLARAAFTTDMDRNAPSRPRTAAHAIWWVVAALLACYPATYAVLSTGGHYSAADGPLGYATPGSLQIARIWLVAGTWAGGADADRPQSPDAYEEDPGLRSRVIGTLFLPLIAADRAFIHQTIHIIVRSSP